MTERQKEFAKEYIKQFNAASAYLTVYRNCSSATSAMSCASRLLKRADVSAYIEQLMEEKDVDAEMMLGVLGADKQGDVGIAKMDEVKAYWTALMRNEGLKEEIRVKVSELIAKYTEDDQTEMRTIMFVRAGE